MVVVEVTQGHDDNVGRVDTDELERHFQGVSIVR
jgi:hypothetical protein